MNCKKCFVGKCMKWNITKQGRVCIVKLTRIKIVIYCHSFVQVNFLLNHPVKKKCPPLLHSFLLPVIYVSLYSQVVAVVLSYIFSATFISFPIIHRFRNEIQTVESSTETNAFFIVNKCQSVSLALDCFSIIWLTVCSVCFCVTTFTENLIVCWAGFQVDCC